MKYEGKRKTIDDGMMNEWKNEIKRLKEEFAQHEELAQQTKEESISQNHPWKGEKPPPNKD
jgi:hypothetical protein